MLYTREDLQMVRLLGLAENREGFVAGVCLEGKICLGALVESLSAVVHLAMV